MTLTILATPTSRLLTTTVRATRLLLLATIRVAMTLAHLVLTRIPAMAVPMTLVAAVIVHLAMIPGTQVRPTVLITLDLLARQVALTILAAAMADRLLATILDHPAVTTQELLVTEVDNVQQVM